ncbi:MAG: transglycosylase domain-containing protein [Thermoleophilia bacterium]
MSYTRRQRKARRSRFPWALLAIAVLILTPIASTAALSAAWDSVSEGFPSLEKEEAYQASNSTLIFDSSPTPNLLAVLNTGERRVLLNPDEVPRQMKDAIVAVEDDRFYEHSGVDVIGLGRAMVANFFEGGLVEGGSTITQQYIKNTYVSNEPTLQRKLKEAVFAYQLEERWSKDEILTEYLNTIYFGDGAYGLQVASIVYFNKPASSLTLPECALLAALPKSPIAYSPFNDPEAAQGRRNLVLGLMLKRGMISQEEYDLAAAAALPVTPTPFGPETTPAPYFIEYVKQQLIAQYGTATTFDGGLRVYTTVDLEKQAAAERAVASVLNQPGDPSAALVSLEPETSYVRAMVGGRDFSQQKFNVATQGHRQPGSSFKPFVLAAAMNKGISPGSSFVSEPKHFGLGAGGAVWDVVNFDAVYLGRVSLEKATVYSDNAVYAEVMMQVGADSVADVAHKAGIKTSFSVQPAIALGGLDTGVTPLELASAYGTFANGGKLVHGTVDFDGEGADPITIFRIEDAAGTVIAHNTPVANQVLDPVIAYHVNSVLKTTAMSGNGRFSNLGRPCAGKSGTTEDHVDAWYSGYTPDLVTTVWIGYPEERVPMVDIRGVRVTGGSWPAQIWNLYMTEALAATPPRDFFKPPNSDLVPVKVDTKTGLIAWPWCPETETRSFLPGHVPTAKCNIHEAKEVVVPEVRGHKLGDIWQLLTSMGLEMEVYYASDPGKPADVIVAQQPAAGQKVMQGQQKIVITVAGAPGSVTVPRAP